MLAISRILSRFRSPQVPEQPVEVSDTPPPVSTLPLFDLGDLDRDRRGEAEAAIRALCNTAYLGEDTALCRALGRYKMFVDTRDVGLSSHIMLDGYWEMWVTEAIARLVRPGMIVADIGANLGYFSVLLADLIGGDGRLLCFEPNPRMVTRLRKTLDVNGFGARSTIHPVALGAKDGAQMVFVVPPEEPKNGHMYPFAGTLPDDGVLLPTVRLDSVPGWDAIDFAKIDVEGAEELIWSGAKGLLDGARLRTVVLEFTPGRYGDPGAFLDRILAYGFDLAQIDPYAGVQPTTRAAILSGNPAVDVMLLLQR